MVSKYNRYFTPEEDQIVRDNYETMSYKDIGNMINRSDYAIKDRIMKLKLPSKHNVKYWTKDELQILKDNYHKDPYFYEKLGRTTLSVTYKAWELGLKAAGRGLSKVNQDFFKHWTNDSAYIVGVIASDGNIHKYSSNYGGVLTIAQKNGEEWLNRMLRKIDSEYSVTIMKYANQDNIYYFAFRSQEVYDDLTKIGIFPNKSLTISKINVPKEYFPAFLLGVFDGDGYWHIPKDIDTNNKRSHTFGICSASWNFLNWIQARIHNYTGLPRKKIYKHYPKPTGKFMRKDGVINPMYRLQYNGAVATELSHWMYVNANTDLSLPRKFNLYMRQISSNNVKRRYNKSTHPRYDTLSKPQFICGGKT